MTRGVIPCYFADILLHIFQNIYIYLELMLLYYQVIFVCSFFRALVKLMKNHSHLMEVDALLIRSCLYLMSLDELIECSTELKAELLDVLHVFFNKAPQEITFSTMQVSGVKETGM